MAEEIPEGFLLLASKDCGCDREQLWSQAEGQELKKQVRVGAGA